MDSGKCIIYFGPSKDQHPKCLLMHCLIQIQEFLFPLMGQNSSASVRTSLQPRNRGSVLDRSRKCFCFSQCTPSMIRWPNTACSLDTQCSFNGNKSDGACSWLFMLCRGMVKHVWSCTSISPCFFIERCLIKHRNHFSMYTASLDCAFQGNMVRRYSSLCSCPHWEHFLGFLLLLQTNTGIVIRPSSLPSS